MNTIKNNLETVRQLIADAAKSSNRSPDEVTLLAVSKTFPASKIREAWEAGQTAFGENYLQEALRKMKLLRDLPIEWHFIGPIQSNKSSAIAENFSWVHGVDRFKIAERLSMQRPSHLPPLNVCIQVNIWDELTKHGVHPEETEELAKAIAALPNLKLRGLMVIPPPANEAEVQRGHFAVLREIYRQLNAHGLGLDTLSMGMSADIVPAIQEGASIVRVGTAVFGQRAGRAHN